MKKLAAILTLLTASSLGAQVTQPAFYLLRQMVMCDTASQPACARPYPTYVLLIARTGNSLTVAYRYSITATLASGEIRTVSGVVERADNSVGNTSVALDFGGAAAQCSINVEELGILSVGAQRLLR